MAKQNLWAPWRISYLKDVTDGPGGPASPPDECFLCQAAGASLSEAERAERLVLLSDQRGTLMLNRYPYTNGHLLAGPPEHVSDLSDLTADRQAGLMALIDLGNRLLQAGLNPQGVNIGMNIGRCAGAGLPGHLHAHLVPRWHGDVNFMDVVGGVRVIPEALRESYEALREAMTRLD